MPSGEIHELHPEVLEAFLGRSPLDSVQAHFGSRRELVHAYIQTQQASYGTWPTAQDQCDVCGGGGLVVGCLTVTWSARVEWRKKQAVLLTVLMAGVAVLSVYHAGLILEPLVQRISPEETVQFMNVHPVCVRCRKDLVYRRVSLEAQQLVLGCGAIISALAFVLTSSVAVCGVLRVLHFDRADALALLPYMGLSLCATVLLIAADLRFRASQVLPPRVAQVVKRPFRCVGHRLELIAVDRPNGSAEESDSPA